MSVGSKSKSLPARRGNEGRENGDGAVAREKGDLAAGGSVGSRSRKQKAAARRYDRSSSGLEFSIGRGPLKNVDAGRLKGQIKRWAKAVVAFARQISFGSPRSVPTPRSGHGQDTPRSAPLLASSSSSRLGAGGAKEGASDVSA
ncbi:uncharacterized protein LOC103636006 [Zea mays]|jgi:hypothetical protein|uniref:Uncharacterized protein n=1 Tax=Zea mays TaxID=4577 RepID=K7UYU6_MAIZE|nr:uncharacterized protein LOC103636006 [Zea mays]AQK96059.1 hypothetical protein ZEAMMB73_Zm00001d011164 [Zea mays]